MARDLSVALRSEVGYRTMDSPFGRVLAISTARGVIRIVFDEEDPEVALDDVGAALGSSPVPWGAPLDSFARELEEYFAGRRRSFEAVPDLTLAGGFPRRVLQAATRIPYGTVTTYGQLAARAGSPRAARAAGSAMRSNPVPLLVPCHRVVPASGGLGGYGGCESRKAALLALEGVP